MTARLTSAASLIALLHDTDSQVIAFALKRLNNGAVDTFWYQIAPHLPLIEELVESADFTEETKQSAALLASRVYFHLGHYQESVTYALASDALFSSLPRCEYSDTILGRCIDMYVQKREAQEAADPRLVKVFDRLATAWSGDTSTDIKTLKEMVGFTLRARREDLLEKILDKHVSATHTSLLLSYTLYAAKQHVKDIEFRSAVLRLLTRQFVHYGAIGNSDYNAVVDCFLLLHDAVGLGNVVVGLLKDGKRAIALQIAFDICEAATQDFIRHMMEVIKAAAAAQTAAAVSGGGDDAAVAAVADASATTPPAVNYDDILIVLQGDVTTDSYLKFLYSHCRADVHIMNRIKRAINPRVAVTHTATVISSALMFSGTTIDGFYRDNIEWLGKARDWAKYTCIAAVGAVHKGHVAESMNILKPYLPSTATVGLLPFQESGSLFALGLMHSGAGVGHNEAAIEYLRNALRQYGGNDIMVHGASMGLGLAAMGLRSEDIFDSLFLSLTSADAAAGEAAGAAIGLVMLGSGKASVVDQVLRCARGPRQKEKVIRGLCMAIAMIYFGKEDMADETIESMTQDLDPWIRVGGVWLIGMAYAGTSRPRAIEKLLAVCVKDVSDEVRRAAISQIGFVTLKDVERCVSMTRTFSDSYNPHIRYGVAIALSVAGAGSANKKAVEMLTTLCDDVVDFVRQAAYIGLSMLLVQHTAATAGPRVAEFRASLAQKSADQKVDVCTKFGTILASGIIDAGGRSATLSLHRSGHMVTKAVVGMFFFTQYWYWFPYSLMLSMALQPTCVIGLTDKLQMPTCSIRCNAPPSKFAPPASVLVEKKEQKAAGPTLAVLSTTAKENEYKAMKKRQSTGGSTSFGSGVPQTPTGGDAPAAMPTADPASSSSAAGGASTTVAAPAKEATFEILSNPVRVTLPQLGLCTFVEGRYQPIKSRPSFGICVMVDTASDGSPDDVVTVDVSDRKDLVKPPAPFDWP